MGKAKRRTKGVGALLACGLCLWAQGMAGQAQEGQAELLALRDSFRQAVYFQRPEMLSLAFRFDSLAARMGDSSEQARGRNFIGMAYWKLGQMDEAIAYYLDALRRYRALGDSLYAGIVLNNMAAAYKERGKPEETIAYYREALALFLAIGDSLWTANVSLNLAHLYNDTERFDEANEASLRALAYFEALRDSPMIMNSLISAGGQPFKQNRFAEALAWYEKALILCQKFGVPEDSATLFSNMGYAKAKLGDFAGGEALLLRSAEIGQRLGLSSHLKKVYSFLTLIYEDARQFEKAFHAQKRYMSLSDSLFSSEKDERMLEMLQKYEASEKERKIQALDAENQLRRRRQQFTLLGLGFALSLAAALLYLYFSKQKSNRLLAEKNALITRALSEKESLLREIHHRVKNNLQVISSLLSLQSKHVRDEGALRALQEGRSRVSAMSLIHQHLYLEQHPTAIHLPTYVGQLTEKLFSAYSLDPGRVELAVEVEDLLLDVDTAIPLGYLE